MKNPRWFKRLASSHVRIASAVALISIGAAIAFVAAKPSGPTLSAQSGKDMPNKFRQERDRSGGNRQTVPGDRDRGPLAAAEEDYAHRAYPAAYVPMELTRAASKGWETIKTSSRLRNVNALLSWTLAGPSMANFPSVLTFSGAAYTTSGRITALAIDPNCNSSTAAGSPGAVNFPCRVWAAAAGGGIWRTDNVLDPTPTWTFVSSSFATNAIGALTYDAGTGTLYAGTGEANASADSEAGFGIYSSTNGGDTWTHLASATSVGSATVDCDAANGVASGTFGTGTAPAYTGPAFDGRGISSIVVSGSTIYVGSARAIRGVISVTSGGAVSLAPGLPPFGLWKSTDGGANFTLLQSEAVCLNPTLPGNAGVIQSTFGSTRGINHAAFDPNTTQVIYAAAFPRTAGVPRNTGGGIWRSVDSGGSFTQIKSALSASNGNDRAEFAVTVPPSGTAVKNPDGFNPTRMYVGIGNTTGTTKFYRTDDAANTSLDTGFTDLSTSQNNGYCTSQCWYDNVVYTPPGKPGVVYLGGSFDYNNYGGPTNGRAFIRSTDAGGSFTDMTWDATTNPTPSDSCCQPNPFAPNGMHPDSHAVVEIPGTDKAIYGSDGGLVRTNGNFSDISSQCSSVRGLGGAGLALCQQLLSAVPNLITGINNGLSTLQFQSLSVAADDNTHAQGGTQDNGTFETYNDPVTWSQVIYGDGGQSGFHFSNSSLRFNSFTSNFHDVNFQNGDPTKWVIASGPIAASGESAQFYSPIISDPGAAGTIFQGSQSVWRTKDWAGNQAFLEANCPEFTASGTNSSCGDFVRIGPSGATNLTASASDYRGTTRSTGNVAALARTSADTGTLWVATTTGRVFVSKNADNATNTAVTFTRIDTLNANSPDRFVSGIFIDPSNPNHAWLAYSSYSTLTSSTPGHVFSVTFNPGGPSATWTNLDGSGGTMFPDFPATAIVRGSNGDLYVSNDWGVLRLPNGSTDWEVAGTGLPMVEVAGLTISPDGQKLYAATHGRSAWVAALPSPSASPTPTPTPTPTATPTPTPIQQVAAPVISPNGGSFRGKVEVHMSDATPGATIYYTINGGDPTTSSTRYTNPFRIKARGTFVVRAKAFKTGLTPSDTTTVTYFIHK